MGEFDRIAKIIERVSASSSSEVVVGPGDDAAVLSLSSEIVFTTDVAVEGIHFRRDWSTPEQIGAKIAAANGADCASMGARPVAYVVSLVTPQTLDEQWSLALADGLRLEAEKAGAHIVGGDLSSGDQVVVSIAAIGALDGRAPVRRSGARVGDRVVLAGHLGRSAAGLALLASGRSDVGADLISVFQTPDVPYSMGPLLADAGATSMIDVSDGLLADLGHICSASGVGMRLFTEQLDCSHLIAAAAELGVDPLLWYLTGGEEHALVATLPGDSSLPSDLLVIGEVVAGSLVEVPGVDTHSWDGGFDHFRMKS